IAWLSTAPLRYDTWEESDARPLTPTEQKFANAEGFEDVASVIPGRCSMCHAREPFYDGIRNAPKGILLETDHDIARAATQIFLQAGVTHAMPPANVSYMEDDERRMIVEWYRNATNS
ncbi:MAG: cysteine desulfurase, partial [Marivivens sp.]|nr:cysteine desulfurase [Marivivens sp.]